MTTSWVLVGKNYNTRYNAKVQDVFIVWRVTVIIMIFYVIDSSDGELKFNPTKFDF